MGRGAPLQRPHATANGCPISAYWISMPVPRTCSSHHLGSSVWMGISVRGRTVRMTNDRYNVCSRT